MDLLIYAFSSAVVPFHSCMAVYEKFKDGAVRDISDELPFEIPDGWAWVRLHNLMIDVATGPFGSMLHKSDYADEGIPLINPMNMQDGKIVSSDKMLVSQSAASRLVRIDLEQLNKMHRYSSVFYQLTPAREIFIEVMTKLAEKHIAFFKVEVKFSTTLVDESLMNDQAFRKALAEAVLDRNRLVDKCEQKFIIDELLTRRMKQCCSMRHFARQKPVVQRLVDYFPRHHGLVAPPLRTR